jgi:hypothetical protein
MAVGGATIIIADTAKATATAAKSAVMLRDLVARIAHLFSTDREREISS